MAAIQNEDLLKKSEDEKKILSALKRTEKALKEITDLGYMLYLSAHGSLNVMNTDVDFLNNLDYHDGQIVAYGSIENIDAGDF